MFVEINVFLYSGDQLGQIVDFLSTVFPIRDNILNIAGNLIRVKVHNYLVDSGNWW